MHSKSRPKKKPTKRTPAPRRAPHRRTTKSKDIRRRPPNKQPVKNDGGGLEIYVQYTLLEAMTLAEILALLDDIKYEVFENFEIEVGKEIEIDPILSITKIATGNSITIKFGGSILNAEVTVSNRITIPILVAVAIVQAYNVFHQAKTNYLDQKIKGIEYDIKKLERDEKLDQKKERDQKKTVASDTFIRYLFEKKEITKVRVNGKRIK